MIQCDDCGNGISGTGIPFPAVAVGGGMMGQVGIRDKNGLKIVSRDLCEVCAARWIIVLLVPVAHPDKAENKD